MTIGLVSYAAASLAHLVIALVLATRWSDRVLGRYAAVAALATLLWAATGPALSGDAALPVRFSALAEWLHNGAWFLLLVRLLLENRDPRDRHHWLWMVALAYGLGGFITVLLPSLLPRDALTDGPMATTVLLGWTLQAIVGLWLIEQAYRNYPSRSRGEIQHISLGLGAAFAYDLFLFSDALLLQRIDPSLWAARGFVYALIAPLIAISAARSPTRQPSVKVSRKVVFHSVALGGAGIYLLTMAAAGSYIRAVGGGWGIVLQVVFLFAAGILLLLLLFSANLRARSRVLLSEHFLRLKYDYREEWLRFTDTLSGPDAEPPATVVKALARIVSSPGGVLWARTEQGAYELKDRSEFALAVPSLLKDDDALVAFLQRTSWIVDLDEYHLAPDLYEGFEAPSWVGNPSLCWLVIPLIFRDEMCGFVMLARSTAKRQINWEDRSLLKAAGRQAASHVAQYLADQALIRAREFEAFHHLSAYVAHDLKNLIGQQSLLLSNAERHRHNPAFFDDVIATIESSVERMNRLMAQLREGIRGDRRTLLQLGPLVQKAVAACIDRPPRPEIDGLADDAPIIADEERVLGMLGHIIQNAQEATPADGRVTVRLRVEGHVALIEVEDTGIGMTADFIRDRLFRPFDSTKGLTGMGIGVFESRELVRLLGGDLTVDSTPGGGSRFRIAIPCAPKDQAKGR